MKTLKKNLAKAHKIIAFLNMADLTYTHLSARCKEEEFLISPFGIQFQNVKPNDFVHFKFNKSQVLRAFEKEKKYNQTGFSIHSSIYKAKKDINCIIHLHTKETIAVSLQSEGLLPISQHALHFYNQVSYHSYNSLILSPAKEEELLIQDLANNNVMFLRNHGFITTGKTIWEALFYAYHLQKACEVQVLAKENAITPLPEVCLKARNDLLSIEKDLGRRDFESYVL